MLHEPGPDLFSFVYIKAWRTPRDSLTVRCLHFEKSAHFRLHIRWICVFLFSASSSTVTNASIRHSLFTVLSVTNRKTCKKKLNILIHIPTTASQLLLHNKLAQKVPSHRCIRIEKESLCLVCCLCIFYVNVSCIYFYTIF